MTDAMLLVGDSETDQNLYYTTHFLAGDPFVYLFHGGERLLVVSPMERGRAEKQSTVALVKTFDDFGYTELTKGGQNRAEAFATVIARITSEVDGALRVAGSFPVAYADRLREAGRTLAIDSDLLESERREKSSEEINAIEDAQRATERATARAFALLSASEERNGILHLDGGPLTSERLRTEIELALVKDGLDPGTPIVAGGPGAADPHWVGGGPLRAGESIVFDVFPRDKRTRYFADMTRTVVKGEPSPLLQDMYDAVLAAQQRALGMIASGVNGRDVHAAVVETFRQRGFAGDGTGPRYTHGTGHGVGLDIHEAPGIRDADVILLEHDVVTVEPGLYDPEVGAVRIEDLVVVTADGCRNLTEFEKRFRL